MKPKQSAQAVMNVAQGEEILEGLVTPPIPLVGQYKLVAKKKKDGTIEWAHFVQRESGLREKVVRGVVANDNELETVIDIMNRNLKNVFGVTMQAATCDVSMADGTKVSGTVH